MTTIACGGGPTLEQRRAFAGLKDGAHIPGYGGYCPQIKYRIGKTFGQDTHELARIKRAMMRVPDNEEIAALRASYQPDVVQPRYKFLLKHELPTSTGDNKYTKEMVPGFTGYIPSMPFRYGGTYRELCDQAIDDMLSKKEQADVNEKNLRKTIQGYSKAQPIARDPRVRDLLNQYRDTHPLRPILTEDHRTLTEAPIPGYKGFVPRVGVTEIGLGARYHKASESGFDAFYRDVEKNEFVKQQPIDLKQTVSVPEKNIDVRKGPVSAFTGRRLYATDGMIPKYTGYIPHRRYAFGNTYGETTRKLSVCNHDQPNYGEHVRRSQVAKSAYF